MPVIVVAKNVKTSKFATVAAAFIVIVTPDTFVTYIYWSAVIVGPITFIPFFIAVLAVDSVIVVEVLAAPAVLVVDFNNSNGSYGLYLATDIWFSFV